MEEVGGLGRIGDEIEQLLARPPRFRGKPHIYELPEGLDEASREKVSRWCAAKGWHPESRWNDMRCAWDIWFSAEDGVQVQAPPRRGPSSKH